MLKFYCFITGDEYNTLVNDTLKSKKKVTLFAWSIAVPVMIWFFCGLLLVIKIINGTLLSALITAFVVSAIVFIIERSMILSNGGKAVAAFRIILAVFVSFIGALIVDEIVFENDIDQQLAKNQRMEAEAELYAVDTMWNKKIDEQQAEVSERYYAWDSAMRRIHLELTGKAGTGIPGNGPMTSVMIQNAAQYEDDYMNERAKLDTLNLQYVKTRNSEKERITASFNNHSVLKRMQAMFDLVKSNALMMAVYSVFTFIFIMLECMVIIVKWSSGKTNYEKKQDLIEDIGARRMNRIAGHDEKYFDPSRYSDNSRKLISDMSRNGSSIFS
jgi:hypothetical protein